MQLVQDPSQSNVNNLNKVRCEARVHFRNKKILTSSVYDCTVEDVEYICNKFSRKYIFNSTVVD